MTSSAEVSENIPLGASVLGISLSVLIAYHTDWSSCRSQLTVECLEIEIEQFPVLFWAREVNLFKSNSVFLQTATEFDRISPVFCLFVFSLTRNHRKIYSH